MSSMPRSEQEPDAYSFMGLLVLADEYQVPYLTCEAEMQLQPAVKKNNCCCLLWLADFYHAGQLKAYCLKYVKGYFEGY